MKKALFINKYPLIEPYSILQKINGQMKSVSNLGYDVYYISFDHNYLYLQSGDKKTIIKKTFCGNSKLYYHLIIFFDLYIAVKKVIKSIDFEFVYFRYSPLNYNGYSMCKKLSKISKIVVEIHTYPLEKEKKLIRKIYNIYSDFWWKLANKCVDLYTLIGKPGNEFFGNPAINIDNAVDISVIPQKEHCKSEKIHILAVASMSDWHGYDRLINGYHIWKSAYKKDVIIDFVGDEGDGSLSKWKQLVKEYELESNIVFHGKKTGDALTQMFDLATIGICSLGLYRIGLNAASVLKLREYMARGLPFVYAHEDPHINNSMAWALKIPNNESPVNMEKVFDFINYVNTDSSLSVRMRDYALNNMSWERQFNKIFNKLEELNVSTR